MPYKLGSKQAAIREASSRIREPLSVGRLTTLVRPFFYFDFNIC